MTFWAQQRDFQRSALHQALRLGEDVRDRARYFGAAGIGNHAEAAELIAAFLHRKEGGRARGSAFFRKEIELDPGKLRVHQTAGFFALKRPGYQVGEAVIGLRTHHEVHLRRPADDSSLGLGDTACHPDQQATPFGPGGFLELPQTTELEKTSLAFREYGRCSGG